MRNISATVNIRYPSKMRKRLQRALDRLKSDGVIKDWSYVEENSTGLKGRKWLETWMSFRVKIEPPDAIVDSYQSVAENRRKAVNQERQTG